VTSDGQQRLALRQAYDEHMREQAEVAGADHWHRAGPLLRAVFDGGAFGFVSYRSLAGVDAPNQAELLDALIADTVAFYAGHTPVPRFEWKTRGHDLPADLGVRLLAHGLVPQPVETVMVGAAALLAVDVPLPQGVTLRRLDGADVDDVHRASAMQTEVFGSPGPSDPETLAAALREQPETIELWVAEATDAAGAPTVVTAGRLVLTPGTGFASIWGGATRPEWRGRGIYRALTAARARSALARGATWLHSDCTDDSRPILERSGLTAVTTTTPYVWTRPVTG
jgi:GNAT superfamily N-acetyltransferase